MSQPSMTTEIHGVLDALIRRCSSQNKPSEVSISSEELSCLRNAFLPSQSPHTRAKSFVALSAFCQAVRNSKQPSAEPVAEHLAKVFSSNVQDGLADTKEDDVLSSISFLVALFQVDASSASIIFREDGVITSLMDAIDICPSDNVALEVAHTFSQACGHKTCREALPTDAVQWLRTIASQTKNSALRAAAAVALVKLSRGALSDSDSSKIVETQIDSKEQMDLVDIMKGMTISGNDLSVLSDAIEGLVYMSAEPAVKEILSQDPSFWKQFFSYIPKRKINDPPTSIPSSIIYGIVTVALNVCAYKPRVTEEETQMLKLRKLANAGKMTEAQDNPLDDDSHVRARCKLLVEVGLVGALSAIVKVTDSQGVRTGIGCTILYLVEEKENRGKVLQEGGAKALSVIIRTRMTEARKDKARNAKHLALDPPDLQAIQALAKLAITSAPFQVFGPGEAVLYDAIRPLTQLVLHPSANLLQRFEGMMALTNLSSANAEVASRIAAADGLLNKVELFLLEEHKLVRRAAMELICNLLAGSDDLFKRYSESSSKLHVLVALSDVSDVPTRLAASGGLAQLTASPVACVKLLALQKERHRLLQIFVQLISPTSDSNGEQGTDQARRGLVHRGVVCVRNFLTSLGGETIKDLSSEIVAAQLPKALVTVAQEYRNTNNAPVLVPAAEALKLLLDCGVEVSV
ncbi:ARM repeat-containing protein [Neolentinus lepideus HHB14362 ss-1]|uniref:ARM repeat-containing protein n=1 Tax=Neolentinus lepideus HHB14362 ss-1 TaxID=1314782 RepID=A0A165W7D2_9AGAM|nr:ARM repeat-containing protein [Neolentinus lepideus HHB14362 ss-1]